MAGQPKTPTGEERRRKRRGHDEPATILQVRYALWISIAALMFAVSAMVIGRIVTNRLDTNRALADFRLCQRTNLPRAEAQQHLMDDLKHARVHLTRREIATRIRELQLRLPIADCAPAKTGNPFVALKPEQQSLYVEFYELVGKPPMIVDGRVLRRVDAESEG